MPPRRRAQKWINANSSSCALVRNKLKFLTNPAVTAMPVIPSVTLRQLGYQFTT
jgi:hypothetical protein